MLIFSVVCVFNVNFVVIFVILDGRYCCYFAVYRPPVVDGVMHHTPRLKFKVTRSYPCGPYYEICTWYSDIVARRV